MNREIDWSLIPADYPINGGTMPLRFVATEINSFDSNREHIQLIKLVADEESREAFVRLSRRANAQLYATRESSVWPSVATPIQYEMSDPRLKFRALTDAEREAFADAH